MPKFERHLFICVNERDPAKQRACCANAGAAEVASALKKAAYDRGLKRIVRVNKSGCLDQCELGVCCVVYPEAVWYGGVTAADAEEIVEQHLVGGKPVERLVIESENLTGKARPDSL
jgi:(2Fe-2S) ferredoxin